MLVYTFGSDVVIQKLSIAQKFVVGISLAPPLRWRRKGLETLEAFLGPCDGMYAHQSDCSNHV